MNKRTPVSNPPSEKKRLSPDRRLIIWLCVFQFAVILTLLCMNWLSWSERRTWRSLPAFSKEKPESHFRGNPGPWGDLEFARINIEPPDAFMDVDAIKFEPTEWFFEGFSRSQLETFLGGCALTEVQRSELMATASWKVEEDGVTLTPRPELILQLGGEARTAIYSNLANSDRNKFHRWPFTYRPGGFDDWFDGSSLSDETIALVRQRVYPDGASLCFADLPEVFPLISTVDERRRLIKTLSRQSALLMKLRVGPKSDVELLTSYWARGGRAKDVEPLLQSLTKIRGGITIDVAHFLPPFARKRLNTFPSPDLPDGGGDCYWTVMNFFNDPPDARYHDSDLCMTELLRDYTEVAAPTFGDLIFLLREDGSPIHAAVYIADDVVFTKNGGDFRQPWNLMKWDDMVARYPESFPIRAAVFHKKPQ